PGEAERPLGDADAGALDPPADRSGEAARVLPPVSARPQLVPVDGDAERAPPPDEPCREQREVRERRRVDDVVALSVPKEVGEHPQSEQQRRQEPPPPT